MPHFLPNVIEFLGLVWTCPPYKCISAVKGGAGLELLFNSIKDTIRLKLFLSANGLQKSFTESRGQFIYTFNSGFAKRDQYRTALVQFIREVKRNQWINNTLQQTFKYENEDERSQIIDIATNMFRGERPELTALAGEINEENLIGEAVDDLLNYDGTVSFDSFLRFRLKKYYERVAAYVDVAIDEYKMEQDYQMFINMLRDYLQKRCPRKSIIHVSLDQEILFYDEHIQKLEKHDIMEMLDRRLLSNHPVYVDSAVIAPLLSMAPQKIFLYTNEEEQALVRTLRNIFEERIAIFPARYFHTLKKAYSEKT